MEERNVPEIRFQGYTGEWERRKLREECQITMGQSPEGSTYRETPSDYILVQGNADLKDNWVCPRIWTTQKTKTADAGDLIMSVRAPAGAMGKTAYNVVLGRGVAGIKGNEFIFQTLVKMDKDGYWKKLAAGSTFESINSDVIENAVIAVPQDVNEQEKLGTYFKNLDHLITLHQRKCKKLMLFKKAMLDNMFPENGEAIPKIRFEGFTRDWEYRKFGEIFEEYSIKGHEELPVLMLVQGKGTVRRDEADRNLQYDDSNLSNYKLVRKNDFIVHLRTFEGGLEKANSQGIVSPAYHIFHGEKADSTLYYEYFRTHNFINVQLKPHVYGIRDGRSIDIEGMKTIQIPYTSIKEQRRIGEYFSSLNNLIALQQDKIEKLQSIKKSMLEKMFV